MIIKEATVPRCGFGLCLVFAFFYFPLSSVHGSWQEAWPAWSTPSPHPRSTPAAEPHLVLVGGYQPLHKGPVLSCSSCCVSVSPFPDTTLLFCDSCQSSFIKIIPTKWKKKLNYYIYDCVNQSTNRVSVSAFCKALSSILCWFLISGLWLFQFWKISLPEWLQCCTSCSFSPSFFFFLNHPHEFHLVR